VRWVLRLAASLERGSEHPLAAADRYDIYGEFGFYDGVEPTSGRVVHAYLALDQAMILVAIANHLRAGRLQRLFEQDPIVEAAIATLRARSELVARRPERPAHGGDSGWAGLVSILGNVTDGT